MLLSSQKFRTTPVSSFPALMKSFPEMRPYNGLCPNNTPVQSTLPAPAFSIHLAPTHIFFCSKKCPSQVANAVRVLLLLPMEIISCFLLSQLLHFFSLIPVITAFAVFFHTVQCFVCLVAQISKALCILRIACAAGAKAERHISE